MNPGEKIHVSCDMEDFPGWQKLVFFNGAEKLGEVSAGQQPEIETTISKDNQVYCLTAVATNKEGKKRTCSPMHFFLRDPALSWKSKKDLPEFDEAQTAAGSKNAGNADLSIKPDHSDSILIAYGLTASQEKSFSVNDNALSDFWQSIDSEKDIAVLSQRKNATEGAAFNFVLTHDCNMKMKAAYGADGLYLLFKINDDMDMPAPNNIVATENEQFLHNYDAVDFMIDSRSVKEISDPENRGIFVSPAFGLTNTTAQYQAPIGTEKVRSSGIRRSVPDPWEMNATYWAMEEAKKFFGLEIESIKTGHFYKAQEWFIPWSQIGSGFETEPDAGTRIAFSGGYNDRDEGEHLPVGVNSSGGITKASNSLRWINKSDPWSSGPKYGEPPYNWGEIVLGPMLD